MSVLDMICRRENNEASLEGRSVRNPHTSCDRVGSKLFTISMALLTSPGRVVYSSVHCLCFERIDRNNGNAACSSISHSRTRNSERYITRGMQNSTVNAVSIPCRRHATKEGTTHTSGNRKNPMISLYVALTSFPNSFKLLLAFACCAWCSAIVDATYPSGSPSTANGSSSVPITSNSNTRRSRIRNVGFCFSPSSVGTWLSFTNNAAHLEVYASTSTRKLFQRCMLGVVLY